MIRFDQHRQLLRRKQGGGVIGPLRIFGTWPHRLSVQYGRQYRFIIKSYKKNSGAYPTS